MSSRSQSHAGQRLARRTQQQRRTLATPTRAKSCTLCCRRRRPLAASNARLEGLATQPGPQGIQRAIVMCARQHKLAQVAYCRFERTLTDGLKGDRCTPPVFSIYKKDTKVDESSMPHNLEAVVLKLDQLLRLWWVWCNAVLWHYYHRLRPLFTFSWRWFCFCNISGPHCMVYLSLVRALK